MPTGTPDRHPKSGSTLLKIQLIKDGSLDLVAPLKNLIMRMETGIHPLLKPKGENDANSENLYFALAMVVDTITFPYSCQNERRDNAT